MITKTKLLLLGTVFSLGATSLRLAADLPHKAPAAAPVFSTASRDVGRLLPRRCRRRCNNQVYENVDFEGFATGAAAIKPRIYSGYLRWTSRVTTLYMASK